MSTHKEQLEEQLERCSRLYGSDSPSARMLRDELRRLEDGVKEPYETYITGFRGAGPQKPKAKPAPRAAEPSVDVFDDDETRILKAWLARTWSADLDEIMDRWEIGRPAGLYSRLDAAVASIVLERVQARLPQFALVDSGARPGEEIVLARKVRPRRASRRVESLSRHLFTINWADNGAGSWPMAYYATRIPSGRELVITASGDSPESFGGVTDVAIGWVQARPAEAIGALIKRDWARWRRQIDQARWVYVLEAGQFDAATVSGWADAVWPTGDAGDED